MRKSILAATAALAMASTSAIAAWHIDEGGFGFVGKGDVQLALGLNNAQLQAQANSLRFTVDSTTVQETSWTCVNANNGHSQERRRTSTTSVQGVASYVERTRNQVTGFVLTGYEGTPIQSSQTDGPPLESCPNANSTYVLDSTIVGQSETVGGGLSVNGVPLL